MSPLTLFHSYGSLGLTLATTLAIACSQNEMASPAPDTRPLSDDCDAVIARGPVFIPAALSKNAVQAQSLVEEEFARSFLKPFECAWKDRTSPTAGLKILNDRMAASFTPGPLPVFVRFEGKAEAETLAVEGLFLEQTAESGILQLYPALHVAKSVTAAKRKGNEPVGDDIPESRDVIDYGNYSYLKLNKDTPPVRWPKESTEPQKSTEIWNAKAKKWVKRTCY